MVVSAYTGCFCSVTELAYALDKPQLSTNDHHHLILLLDHGALAACPHHYCTHVPNGPSAQETRMMSNDYLLMLRPTSNAHKKGLNNKHTRTFSIDSSTRQSC